MNKKISALPSATVPLAGTEVLPIVQDNTTVQVSVADLTNGRFIQSTQVDITAQGQLRLQDTLGGEYIALRAPGTVNTSYLLTLPASTGASGQAMITDGAGNLSWGPSASGTVVGPSSATNNALARFDTTTGLLIKNSVGVLTDGGALSGLTALSSTAVSVGGLTNGRVTYAGASGALQDNANLTFDGTTLTTNSITATSANLSGALVGTGSATLKNLTVSGAVVVNSTTNDQYYSTTGSAAITISSAAPGIIDNMQLGANVPTNVRGTTITATNQFTGSGAGLTNIPNSSLNNSAIVIGATNIVLGGSTNTLVGLNSITAASVAATNLSGNLAGSNGLPLTTGVTGVLPIANGGNNSTATPTAGGVAYGDGSAYQFTSVGTSGQFLRSTGAGAPAWSTISTAAGTIGISTNSTNATYYPTYYTAQSGTATTEYTNPNYTFNPSTGALSATSFIENGSNIVSQKDIGTNANQIPLNQHLGTMAWQDAKAVQIAGGSTTNLVGTSGYQIQPTITTLSATATLTIAQLLTYIIQVTSASAVALTLPTGTLTDAGILNGLGVVNNSFTWRIINTGSASGAITLSAGTAHTIVGSATVAIGTSAQFQTVKTATNTFVTYRIA